MFTINYQSPTPVYKQLYENVIRLVSFGALKTNDKLPPVRTIAGELGINPTTVSKAYSMLENDGYIYSAVGRGSFISENFDSREAEKTKIMKNLKESFLLLLKILILEKIGLHLCTIWYNQVISKGGKL